MHPRLAELTDLLARERAGLLAAVAAVPTEARDRAPTPGGWTVGQILEHLRLTEDGSARLLARRVAREREQGLGAESATDSVLGRVDAALLVDGPPRVAPEIITPAAEVGTESALAALAASRDALLAVVRDADGLALGAVRLRHEVLGEIDAYQWLEFIALHEARHARQVRAIAGATAAA